MNATTQGTEKQMHKAAGMNAIGQSIEELIHKVTRGFALFPGIVIFCMMLIISLDVFGRYLLNMPLRGGLDFVDLAMVVAIFFGFAHCAMEKRNVEVDLVYLRFPQVIKSLVNILSPLVCAGISAVLAWQLGGIAWDYMVNPPGDYTMLLLIPYYPFMFVAAVCCALLFLEFVVEFARSLSKLKRQPV
jgi:TRAP-type C4-dicarboxylate transport system permease small subunit